MVCSNVAAVVLILLLLQLSISRPSIPDMEGKMRPSRLLYMSGHPTINLSILSNNIALKRIFSILITREITDQKSGSVLIMSTDMTPTQKPRIRIQWMVKRGPLKVGRASVEVMQTYVYFSTIRISLMLCKMELCSVLHRWT